MNTSKLSKYAPKARRAMIVAVTAQAARIGITAKASAPAEVQGDVLLVNGQAFPASVAEPRAKLVKRIAAHGFEQTMEAIAYTWFNRFVAIRYMELHGYLDHGYRVLSHPEGTGRPEILDHAADIDLAGLDREQAIELKLDGAKDEALYRLLLLAQCNALHDAMPFLFERIGDETELLLPANLLHTDSVIRDLVEQLDESLWQDIEIIGWLYQFYISEKKDEVIGKVVKSEDIPAATQLFTPNWIVKYMVQNSLGAQWLATYPDSPVKALMEYYIEPAEQTEEVNAQLAAITPSQLDPEKLTLIDPACGSGHILVEAYELFKAIYLERGYRLRDIPQLILEKNLFGLDIDERAAQLTGFALMMKGRADDRRLFERRPQLNVVALLNSAGFDAEAVAKGVELSEYGLEEGSLTRLKRLFEYATTFGSLIEVPEALVEELGALRRLSRSFSQDLFVSSALDRLQSLVRQAEVLSEQYDVVVANPPYMGGRGMVLALKNFVKSRFPRAKSDLFSCFIERGYSLVKPFGYEAMVTMQGWMFIASFENLREEMLRSRTIRTMAHLGSRAFGSISGEVVQTTSFVLRNATCDGYRPTFIRLVEGGEPAKQAALAEGRGRYDTVAQSEFQVVPGSPIAYWIGAGQRRLFLEKKLLGDVVEAGNGLQTNDNASFLRLWHEVAADKMGIGIRDRTEAEESGKKWFPYNKGGGFRKWYGNEDYVIDWERDGRAIRARKARDLKAGRITANNAKCWNESFYFKESVTWSDVTSLGNSFRLSLGSLFDITAPAALPARAATVAQLLAYLNSSLAGQLVQVLNPTLHFNVGNFRCLPTAFLDADDRSAFSDRCVSLAAEDWHSFERSWDFSSFPLLVAPAERAPTLEAGYDAWVASNRQKIVEMKRLEEENNQLFVDAYRLADELTTCVSIEQITLTVNPAYRYGGKLTEEEQWIRFRQDTMEELVSYAIGCMMGRYSLDAPGLIYAHSGNEGFDPSRYRTFPADDDGIVPLTDTEWFEDDACNRVVEFISVAWDSEHLEENLAFLAANLSPKKNEARRETIRRYLCDRFFKDHLQTYKSRPIYWLFSSGKQKAFQCLVYLHRYNAGTLARIRSEYVIPLQGRMAARLEALEADVNAATSTAQRKRFEKEQAKLLKQQAELLTFDEKLRHYADMRIELDLDDGVKVNYGKFGDLLAEVKTVHGRVVGNA